MCDGPSPTPRVRARLTYKVVPRWTSESDFWRLYFSQATSSQRPPPQRDPHARTCAAGSIHPRKCAHVRHVPASSAAAAAAERGASGSGAGVRAAAGARGAAALRPGGGVERVLCGAVMHTLETGRLWGEPWAYCIFCQCIMSCCSAGPGAAARTQWADDVSTTSPTRLTRLPNPKRSLRLRLLVHYTCIHYSRYARFTNLIRS